MRRRDFVMAALMAPALPSFQAYAQPAPGKVWRVGYLYPGNEDDPVTQEGLDVFRTHLAKLGYTEGRNVVIDTKFANGTPDRLGKLARDMVAGHPDMIAAIATPAIAAAQKETNTIPIVMMPATDPIGSGFVKSLAHPGGNITGMANMYGDSLGKTMELLHELLPAAKRLAILASSNPTHPQQLIIANDAAKALGIGAISVVAPNESDLGQAFEKITAERCDALFVLADPVRPPIVTLAARAKLPAVYQYVGFVDLGGLASYGAEFKAIIRKGAEYAVRIFKGANPAETPVEQPVAFELAINLKTAKELGLSVPGSILARADKIIE